MSDFTVDMDIIRDQTVAHYADTADVYRPTSSQDATGAIVVSPVVIGISTPVLSAVPCRLHAKQRTNNGEAVVADRENVVIMDYWYSFAVDTDVRQGDVIYGSGVLWRVVLIKPARAYAPQLRVDVSKEVIS